MKRKLTKVFLIIIFLIFISFNAIAICNDKNLVYLKISDKAIFNFIVPDIPKAYILLDERNLESLEKKALKFIEKYSENYPVLLQLKENRYQYNFLKSIKYRSRYNSLFVGEFGIQFNTLNSSYSRRNQENVSEMIEKSNTLISEVFQDDLTTYINRKIYNNEILFTQYYKGIKVDLANNGLIIAFNKGKIDSFYYNFHLFKEIDEVLEKNILSPIEALNSSRKAIQSWSKHWDKKLVFDCVTMVYADANYDKVFNPVWEFSTQDEPVNNNGDRYVLCIDALTGKLLSVYR